MNLEESAVYVVVDRQGQIMGPFRRAKADEYAALWDREWPNEAPHVVRTYKEVKASRA